MSHDQFGFPVPKVEFGRDLGLDGQRYNAGTSHQVPIYLRWMRTDAFSPVAGGARPYLPFDCPPLATGSVIRATVGAALTAAGDEIGLGVSTDWMEDAPTLVTGGSIQMGNGSSQGTYFLHLFVAGRNLIRGFVFGSGSSAADFSITGIDCATSNRFAVYTDETTAITVYGALVEVFIPRVYR